MEQIKDILGLKTEVGDTILGISGSERTVHEVEKISSNAIYTTNHKVFFIGNFIRINDIISKNAEYFI